MCPWWWRCALSRSHVTRGALAAHADRYAPLPKYSPFGCRSIALLIRFVMLKNAATAAMSALAPRCLASTATFVQQGVAAHVPARVQAHVPVALPWRVCHKGSQARLSTPRREYRTSHYALPRRVRLCSNW